MTSTMTLCLVKGEHVNPFVEIARKRQYHRADCPHAFQYDYCACVGELIQAMATEIERLEGTPTVCPYCEPHTTNVLHAPCHDHAGVA